MDDWELELEEWELIAFFGQDPDLIDKEEAEFFGHSGFTMKLDDGDVLVFTLQRNFRALYVTLSRDQAKRIDLAAEAVRNVKIERLHGVETMLAVFGPEHDLRQVRLMLIADTSPGLGLQVRGIGRAAWPVFGNVPRCCPGTTWTQAELSAA